MSEKIEQYLGTGRRKTSVARIYLRPGKGRFIVNGKELRDYFGNLPRVEAATKAPLVETQTVGRFDVIVNVTGGGPTGQAGAIRHGLSRALIEVSAANRPVLKKAGFLTRDPRVVERKKPGLHKARRASQFSKR